MADDYKTKIVIEGDSSGAEDALNKTSGGVKSLLDSFMRGMGAVGRFMEVFSKLTWIAQSVQLVIQGVRALRDWLNRAAIEAKTLREELEKAAHDTAMAHLESRYQKLCKALAEANRLERERTRIIADRRAKERDIEDANLERDRQAALSALDPAAADYETKKAEINRAFAGRSADLQYARAVEDDRIRTSDLREEAKNKDAEAAALARELAKAWKINDAAVERRWAIGMELRRDPENEELQQKSKEIEEEFIKSFDAAKKIEEAMTAARREAESLRRQAAESGTGGAAALREEAKNLELERTRREEDARRAAEAKEAALSTQRSEAGSLLTGILAADAVGGNRLTAMGLGSGVTGSPSVADDVKRIVKLLEEEIQATKAVSKPSTFTE